VRRVRPLAALLSPVARRLVYPGSHTRLSPDETDLGLRVDGVMLRGWEVNPGQQRALVYYGGNGEGLDWLVPELGHRFPDHTSYLIAYRGYGASEGRPREKSLTTDALAVFDHAAARHHTVDVVGRSLGSGVAMQVAVRRPIGRLVLITPFDSLVATAADLFPWLPVRHLLRDRWDSASVAHRLRAPVLVVRAGRDATVWPVRTDRLLDVLPADTAVLNLPEAEHASLHEDPAYWPAIQQFLAP
jgi:pimeloyl-ACP methyl ester carboxylesterase